MESEASFQARVIELATHLGVTAYHPYDSRRSAHGYPDLTCVGRNGVLFRELKREDGRESRHQVWWRQILCAAGADAGVWRPSDWPRIVEELRALGRVEIPKPPPTQAELRRMLDRQGRRSVRQKPF